MEEKMMKRVILMLLMMFSSFAVEFAAAETYCHMQRRLLVSACNGLLYRRPPTAECCKRLRETPENCVCPIITPQLAALIDVNYAVGVIRSCGRQVPRHHKCGSLTTP